MIERRGTRTSHPPLEGPAVGWVNQNGLTRWHVLCGRQTLLLYRSSRSLLWKRCKLEGIQIAAGQQLEAMAALRNPSYRIKGWQGCLFTIVLTTVAILFNKVIFRIHTLGFVAVVVVLWTMGPRGGGSSTVTTFESNGWSSVGLSCLVGILSPVVALIGADSQCHLSAELQNAAYVLPRVMVVSATVNYIMGFVMTLVKLLRRS
jgi:amino acid transporter